MWQTSANMVTNRIRRRCKLPQGSLAMTCCCPFGTLMSRCLPPECRITKNWSNNTVMRCNVCNKYSEKKHELEQMSNYWQDLFTISSEWLGIFGWAQLLISGRGSLFFFFFFMVAGTVEPFEGTFSSSSFKVRPLQHNNKLWCKHEAATT